MKCGLMNNNGWCPNEAAYVMSGADVVGKVPVCEDHKARLDYPRFIGGRMILFDTVVDLPTSECGIASPRFRPIPEHECKHFDQNRQCFVCGAKDTRPVEVWIKEWKATHP